MRFLLVLVMMAASLCYGQALKMSDLEGTYEVRMSANRKQAPKAQDPKTTPPGQIQRFYISNGHWILRDMMVGFDGEVKIRNGKVVLITHNTPSGPSKKRERMIFKFSKAGTLTMEPDPSIPGNIVYVRTSKTPKMKFVNGEWK